MTFRDRNRGAAWATAVALLLTTSLACRTKPESSGAESQLSAESETKDHYIYRSDEQGVIGGDCGAVVREAWAIPDPPPSDLPTAAVREVLRGVKPSRALHAAGTKPLIEYFRGVRVENTAAILSFDEEALEYLNNAACAQAAIKSPMVRTLLDFPNIRSVEFEIDGQIFTDWDA